MSKGLHEKRRVIYIKESDANEQRPNEQSGDRMRHATMIANIFRVIFNLKRCQYQVLVTQRACRSARHAQASDR